ncbi:MAG: malate dehydrogenase [Pseudomonadota bacterium]|nr:malate dehydrogenase [Pseudomonadota bacterium]
MKILITGAAGQISYSLVPFLCERGIFASKEKLDLSLVEIPPAMKKLDGFVKELEDSAYSSVNSINTYDNINDAVLDADWCLLVGSIPRGIVLNGKEIKERADLLQINGSIFTEQGKAIGSKAKNNCKVLVVGNPANTNALIGYKNAKNPNQLWMAMTMLDALRAKAQVAKKLGCHVDDIYRLAIFGNHSPTMFPDLENSNVSGKNTYEQIGDHEWVENNFLPKIQQRGAEIIDARGASSASSAARAACDTVKNVEHKTRSGDVFNAAVLSDGSYDVAEGIFSGFPLISDGEGNIKIVRDFNLSEFAKSKIKKTSSELLEERELVKDLL